MIARVGLRPRRSRGGRARPQVQRRRLARPAARASASANSAAYSSSDPGVPSGRGGVRSCSSSAKNHGSLHVGHEDLRVAAEHLVERGGAALGVADDEEVGQPPAASSPSPIGRGSSLGDRVTAAAGARGLQRPLTAARRPAPRRRSARPCGSSGLLSCSSGARVERDQAPVDDHHHPVAHVERRHAVGDR